MKKVQRWRYYCDFCKKSGGGGAVIAKHEQACTLNPGRVCGLCRMFGEATPVMAELLAVLPDPKLHMRFINSQDDGWTPNPPVQVLDDKAFLPLLEIAMTGLRKLTSGCPACIMAALRIKGIPVPMVESFDYKTELSGMMNDFNQSKFEENPHDYF